MTHTIPFAPSERRSPAELLLQSLLEEIGESDEPRFNAEQYDLIERRLYEIRAALRGENSED